MQYIRKVKGNLDRRENARNEKRTRYAQTLLVSLCGLMLCLPVASSAEVKTDAQWKYSVTDDGVEILLYRGKETSVCIPDAIEGTKVYSIGAEAFKQKNVVSVEIPEGVSSIGRSAFEGCRELKEVKLPNTLEKIDRWVFWNCKSLQVVQLPPSIKDPKIDAFKGCDSLREVHICNRTLLNTPPTTSTTDIRKMLGVSSRMVKIVQYDDDRLNARQAVADDDQRYKKVGKYRVRKYADPEQVVGTETLELILDRGELGLPQELASTNIEVELGADITLPTEIVAHATNYLADKFAKGECEQLYDFDSWRRTYGQDKKDMRFSTLVAKNGETLQLKDKRNLKLTAFWKPREKAIIEMDFGEGTYTSERFEAFVGVEIALPNVTEKIEEARQELVKRKSADGWRCDYDFVNWSLDKGRRTFENGARITLTPFERYGMTLKAVWKPHVAYCIRRGVLEQVEMNGHDTLVIPADVTEVSATLFGHRFESRDKRIAGWRNLATVEVSPENKNCFVKDGILYFNRKGSPQRQDGKDAIRQEDDLVVARLIKERESITLPENVTSIGESAFDGCSTLANIDIPGAKSIGEYAFGACVNLGCVKIGGVLTNIAENAFVGCLKLTNLVFSSDIDKIVLDGLPNGIHITLPSSVRAFKLRSSDANKIERFSLTITTQDGAVTREVVSADLGKSQWDSGWSEWDWMRRQAELQTRSADKEKALLYPADAICNAHPKLYREFCAGADRLWCVEKIKEMGPDNNRINLICDEKFGILTAVRVTFPSPGVSLEALLAKYKKQETGRFWVRGPKGDDELFYTGIIDKAKALLATNRAIAAGDDELMIVLVLSDDHWTENSKVSMIEVSSRKLSAALTELDRKEKAAMQAARERAEKKAQKKLDSEALDF